MQINYLKLCNFSSYAGEHSLDLSVSPYKPLVLIGGQNGAGKTSIFTAIKIALYGYLSFKYQSANHHYFSKIKELINNDAFSAPTTRAYVEVEVIVPKGVEEGKYTIHREWTISEKKTEEILSVWAEGIQLSKEEQNDFIMYLYSLVPPNLFDYFFFDGEEIGTFFNFNSNRFLTNAILTLRSYDTFGLIKKLSGTFIDREESSTSYDEAYEEYENILLNITNSPKRQESFKQQIKNLQNESGILQENLLLLESKFKSIGGLSEKEIQKLQKKLRDIEFSREKMNQEIRFFIEDLMPFYITRDLSQKIDLQLAYEDHAAFEQSFWNGIFQPDFNNLLEKLLKQNGFDNFDKLLSDLEKEKEKMSFSKTCYLDFSLEQKKQIIWMLERLKRVDKEAMINIIQAKKDASLQVSDITRRLREAASEKDIEEYKRQKNELLEKIDKNKKDILETETSLSDEVAQEELLKKEMVRIRKKIIDLSRDKGVYELLPHLEAAMQDLLEALTEETIQKTEELTFYMFSKILGKRNFVDAIEISDDFNIHLYKKQLYTSSDLVSLFKNVSYDEACNRLGEKSMEVLRTLYKIDSQDDIIAAITSNPDLAEININLYQKIELSQLSKGEKQIFILSLYWAIIKSSTQDIPFIIDTPYARIDTEYRASLSKEYFPQISNQVIILSTDEEFVGTDYKLLKKYISKEYTLLYQEGNTVVRSGYFKEDAK